jgi:F-type H+-transporting ATPase subunit delta
MGSATRVALASATTTLGTIGTTGGDGSVDLATGEQLLNAALVVGGSPQLRAALADDSAEADNKRSIVAAVFGAYTQAARAVLDTLVVGRWSSEEDLVAGIEELGIRALADSAAKTVSIEAELFSFGAAVSSNAELELALGSKLGSAEGRVALVDALLDNKASKQTVAIVGALVSQPRGRRIGELLRFAANVVADQAGLAIATVTVAKPIAAAQLDRLVKGLSATYGTGLRVNQVVDPRILGGIRVQVGDDVIDGSIATRLSDLRLQLAR